MPVEIKKIITVKADLQSMLDTIKEYVAANMPELFQKIEAKTIDDIVSFGPDPLDPGSKLVVVFKQQDDN